MTNFSSSHKFWHQWLLWHHKLTRNQNYLSTSFDKQVLRWHYRLDFQRGKSNSSFAKLQLSQSTVSSWFSGFLKNLWTWAKWLLHKSHSHFSCWNLKLNQNLQYLNLYVYLKNYPCSHFGWLDKVWMGLSMQSPFCDDLWVVFGRRSRVEEFKPFIPHKEKGHEFYF